MTERQLPKYQSIKQVWALKIIAIEILKDGRAKIVPKDGRYAMFETKHGGFDVKFQGDEDDLGYYVQYKDGYESWSPTKAFEEGYILADDFEEVEDDR